MRILLLGGSSEASLIARAIAGDSRFEAVLSLAGRTQAPQAQPVPTRIGGFGGAAGLTGYLRDRRIDVIVDATHPFASAMSRHAAEAAAAAQVPLLAVERPPWQPAPGDRWLAVAGVHDAVGALGEPPRTVFAAIGSLSLPALEAAPQHAYVIRLIDRPKVLPALPRMRLIQARGPFRTSDDIALFQAHGIEVVLAKNSGGEATVSKIEAARALGLPVVMIGRPPIPPRPTVATAAEALAWLDARHARSARRGV